MLLLLFKLGADRYALDAGRVVEIVPLVALKKVPQAPKGLAGIFNYRGQPVPAVDLCELALDRPASERLSTRIIIINYHSPEGTGHLLGLIAEHATQTLRKDAKEFVDPGIQIGGAQYLGPVLLDPLGPIQLIHEQRLLTARVRDLLFAQPAAARGGSLNSPATG